jgi:hypothetical protein
MSIGNFPALKLMLGYPNQKVRPDSRSQHGNNPLIHGAQIVLFI